LPRHPVFSASYHTKANICQSGPSDQFLDQTYHCQRINSEVIQWSKSSRCTRLPCLRPHRSKPRRLSLLSSAILSLLRPPNSGNLKSPDHHKKTSLLLTRKPQVVFIAFITLACRKKTAMSLATRSFKPPILSHQPSTANTMTTIEILSLRAIKISLLWLKISLKNFTHLGNGLSNIISLIKKFMYYIWTIQY